MQSYAYDALGRLTRTIDKDWYVTDYHYRGDGQKDKITVCVDDEGEPLTIYSVSYMYDALGRVNNVFDSIGGVVSIYHLQPCSRLQT